MEFLRGAPVEWRLGDSVEREGEEAGESKCEEVVEEEGMDELESAAVSGLDDSRGTGFVVAEIGLLM